MAGTEEAILSAGNATSAWSTFKTVLNWIGIIALVFVIITFFIQGYQESVKEKSSYPLVKEFGGRFFASEKLAGQYFSELKSPETTPYTKFSENQVGAIINFIPTTISNIFVWGKLLWLLFCNLYFICVMFWVIYKIYSLLDCTSTLKNILYTIITMAFMELFYGAGLLISSAELFTTLIKIVFSVVSLSMIFVLYFSHRSDVRNMSFKFILIFLLIISTTATAGIITKTEEIVPFTGIFIIAKSAWNFITQHKDFVEKVNYIPSINGS